MYNKTSRLKNNRSFFYPSTRFSNTFLMTLIRWYCAVLYLLHYHQISGQGRLPSTGDDLEDDLDQGSEVSSQTTSGSTDDLDQVELETSDAFDTSCGKDSSAQDDETEEDVSECTDRDQVELVVTTDAAYSAVEIGNVDASEKTDQTMSQSSSADTISDMKAESPQRRAQSLIRKGVSEEQLSVSTNIDESLEIDVSEAIQPTLASHVALREGDIGSVTDDDIPLVHCVRQLSSRFLLTGE